MPSKIKTLLKKVPMSRALYLLLFAFLLFPFLCLSSIGCNTSYTCGAGPVSPAGGFNPTNTPCTPTFTYSPTQTNSPTPTATAINTLTPTGTPTSSFTQTATSTSTPTITSTPNYLYVCANETPIGNTNLPYNGYANAANYIICESFIAPASGTVGSAYVYSGNTAGNVLLGIYSNNGTNPNTVITQSNVTPLSSGWNLITFISSVSLIGGTTYWTALATDSSATIGWTSGTECITEVSFPFGTLWSPWTATDSLCVTGVADYCLYLNFCP